MSVEQIEEEIIGERSGPHIELNSVDSSLIGSGRFTDPEDGIKWWIICRIW